MKSMTGYGRSEKRIEKHTFTVEMKSVNHRYCDIAIRLPRSLLMIEDQFKKKIQEKIHRGKLDVYVTLHSSEATNKKVTIDWSLAQEYMTSLEHVKEQFHLQGNLQLSDLLRIEGLFSMEEIEEDVGRYRDTLIQCVEEATEQLVQMRMSEGAALCQDIKTRIRGIQRVIKELEQVAGKVKVHYAERSKNV
ncbi:YicC/YloC family endoribonuclease [Caldalkalibacillus mannanilyticus]|uniref:YicC/YloC family endoribonuclease n=1 Tax=Caldalkalibacillus mannanilyticus TaxID=1418 RepID=UPI0006847EB0|nr:YicC/YloC family endoribonuclease [Caldalkalibacillus mannanilyticus]